MKAIFAILFLALVGIGMAQYGYPSSGYYGNAGHYGSGYAYAPVASSYASYPSHSGYAYAPAVASYASYPSHSGYSNYAYGK